jgi:hypothetical protein
VASGRPAAPAGGGLHADLLLPALGWAVAKRIVPDEADPRFIPVAKAFARTPASR